MTKGIYCYYDNLKCEIVYVGKDSYIDKNKRNKDHYTPSLKGAQRINRVLQNDNKSGRYSYAVLEQGDFTDDELNQKEISWIAFFKPRFCFQKGGDGTSPGNKHPNFDPCIKIRKRKNNKCKQRFYWEAKLSTPEGEKYISNVSLLECMRLVEEFINSERNVYKYKTFKVVGFIYGVDRINYRKDFSGANHPQFNPCIKIIQTPNKTCTQGYRWVAYPTNLDRKSITISSVDLQKCIKKVQEFIDSKRNVYGYTHYEVEYRNI